MALTDTQKLQVDKAALEQRNNEARHKVVKAESKKKEECQKNIKKTSGG